jgi:hypothetical protein
VVTTWLVQKSPPLESDVASELHSVAGSASPVEVTWSRASWPYRKRTQAREPLAAGVGDAERGSVVALLAGLDGVEEVAATGAAWGVLPAQPATARPPIREPRAARRVGVVDTASG